jgi:hypothetical protein
MTGWECRWTAIFSARLILNALARRAHGDDQSWVTEMTLKAPDIPAPSPADAFDICRSLFTKTSATGSYQISQLTGPYTPIEPLATYDGGPDNGRLVRSNFTVRT